MPSPAISPGPPGSATSPSKANFREKFSRYAAHDRDTPVFPAWGSPPSPLTPGTDLGPRLRSVCDRRLLGRSAAPWTERSDRRHRVAARSGPQSRHGIDGSGHRVGGPLVVDPPPDELRPGLLRSALDREAHLAHPGHRVEKLGVGQAYPGFRIGLIRNIESHHPGDPV